MTGSPAQTRSRTKRELSLHTVTYIDLPITMCIISIKYCIRCCTTRETVRACEFEFVGLMLTRGDGAEISSGHTGSAQTKPTCAIRLVYCTACMTRDPPLVRPVYDVDNDSSIKNMIVSRFPDLDTTTNWTAQMTASGGLIHYGYDIGTTSSIVYKYKYAI